MASIPSAADLTQPHSQKDAKESPTPTPQLSPSKSDNDVTSASPPVSVAHADDAPPSENEGKGSNTNTPQTSPDETVDDDKQSNQADSKLNLSTPIQSRPSSATKPSPKSADDKDTDAIDGKPSESPNSNVDKLREKQSITPIKGKASPKPHVIKVTEKKEPEKETTTTPIPTATYNNNNTSPKNSQQNNNNIGDEKKKTDATKDGETKLPLSNMSEKPHGSSFTAVLKERRKSLRAAREDAKTSDIAGDICRMFSVLFALGVRAFLWGFCMFTIWLVVHRLENDYYYLMCITFIFHILETVNIVVARAGQERKWFCLCFLCYLISTIPCMWVLEIDRLNDYQAAVSNASALAVGVAGVTANITLDPNTLLAVTEQCLIFILILCRWLLPRGDITRDQLSQLLFVYIGMASDVMELFTLFDESSVREDRTLTYVILGVWSLSLLQFTLVLTMSRNPKKVRTALDHDDETARIKRKRLKDTPFILLMTQSELWSLCISIFMQDGPFLAVRVFTMVTHSLLNYTIIFFTCKNILVILLLLYRVLILLVEKWENRHQGDDIENDNDDDYNVSSKDKLNDGNNRPKTVSTHLSLSDVEDEKSRKPMISNNNGDLDSSEDNNQGLRARHHNQVSPA